MIFGLSQNATKLPHLDMWVGGHCSLAVSSVQAGYTALQVCMIAAAVGVGAVFLTGLAAWRKMLSTKSENLGGSQYGIDMMAFGSDEHSFGPSKTLLPKRLQLDSMEEDLWSKHVHDLYLKINKADVITWMDNHFWKHPALGFERLTEGGLYISLLCIMYYFEIKMLRM